MKNATLKAPCPICDVVSAFSFYVGTLAASYDRPVSYKLGERVRFYGGPHSADRAKAWGVAVVSTPADLGDAIAVALGGHDHTDVLSYAIKIRDRVLTEVVPFASVFDGQDELLIGTSRQGRGALVHGVESKLFAPARLSPDIEISPRIADLDGFFATVGQSLPSELCRLHLLSLWSQGHFEVVGTRDALGRVRLTWNFAPKPGPLRLPTPLRNFVEHAGPFDSVLLRNLLQDSDAATHRCYEQTSEAAGQEFAQFLRRIGRVGYRAAEDVSVETEMAMVWLENVYGA